MSDYNDDLAAIKAQGQNQKFPKKEDQKFTNSELLKKYFFPIVPKGQTNSTFKFRIIPNKEGGTPFKEVKFHYMKVGTKWQKLLCLEEHGHDCPLCDTYQGLVATGDKEEAKKYRSSTFYIVRGIDRNKEEEGVKFWRFKKNFKGNGDFDKIDAKIDVYGNIIHPETGYDLILTCGLDDRGNSLVKDISCVEKTPLASTPEKIKSLIEDDTTWKDVFRPKSKQDLEDVVLGRAQYWDDILKKYVRPGEDGVAVPVDNNTSQESKAPVSNSVDKNPLMKGEAIEETNIVSNDIDDDDLPF